ncbi:beta strand repeat-containing protein [Campylobacter concisus]|uniref:beta strand repeat-containing protein n=1 Tax=Campylobacter concisus TaxID=199 RepID=UPI000CD98399|nr:retention module-containing protein [Campylobacter concisus]
MAKEAGVVKSINGGIARALNDLTGEVRQLSVGDIVYQGEKIVTEGSNSKVTITQTDGKDITLIGKDTLTLDQDSNNNETVADISALQQAILKGTDLNALEETAAGGPQAGGNGGDGVSLSSTSFAEGGHISNINANVGSIDALSLAAGGDNSFGVSGGSAVGAGAGAGAGATTPKIGINISSAGSNEGGVMTYDLSLPTALTARPTTLNLNFSGGVAGVDYDANSVEYSIDGGNTWTRGTTVNLADANQINNVKVRVTTIDNYGHNGVDIATNPTAQSANQNQGEQDGSKYSNLNGVEYGVYKRNLTLNVTTDNDEIINSQANGKITDNDDYVNINEGLSEAVFTGDGDDTVNMSGAFSDVNSYVSTEDGDDVINVKSGSVLNYGNAQIDAGDGNDTINLNQGSFVGISGSSGTRIYGGDGDDTFNMDGEIKGGLVYGDDGDDTFNVGSTGVLKDGATIYAGEGKDTINFDGTAENGAKIEGNGGYDTINIKSGAVIDNSSVYGDNENEDFIFDEGSEINIDGTVRNNSNVYGGARVDTVNINGTVENSSMINTRSGDDKVNINAGAEIKNSNINTGEGGDVVNIKGKLGDSAMIDTEDGDDIVNFAGETSGYATINTGLGKDTFNIESGATFSKSLRVDTGEDDDTINIKNGANLSWGSIKTGAGNDTVNIDGNMIGTPNHFNEISTGSGDDMININGHVSGESRIKAGEGNNTVYVRGTVDGKARIEAGDVDNDDKHSELHIESGATLSGGSSVSMGGGNDTIYIKKGSSVTSATISAGNGNDTAYINENLDTVNIKMGNGEDTINFKKGITIEKSLIDFGEGNDKIDIDGITFTNGAELRAGVSDQPAWYSDDDDDIINITNSKFEQNSKIDAKIGDDRINIGTGAIIDNSNVIAGYGSDTININAGSKVINGSKIYSGLDNKDGDRRDLDTININGGEIMDSEIHTSHSKTTTNINDGILTNAKILGAYGEDKININGGVIKNSEITGGDGDDKININGGNFTETKISTGNGKYMGNGDVVNIAGGTFSKTTVELQGTKNTVNINSGAVFGDQSDAIVNRQYQTKIVNYDGEDHVNVNAGAIVKNATFDLNGGSDTITVASGATVEHSQLITGDDVDTLNINGTVSGDTHVDLGYGADTLNIGNGGVVSASDIHMDDGGQGYNDTINIANNVTLQDWADIKGGGGVDTITAGDNLKLINGAGIHGDWGNNGSAENKVGDGNDIITIGNNLTMSGGSIISGGGGNDIISIGKNASIDGSSTIDGGAGYDTLKVADNSIDFSHVKNIEKLDITDVNKTSADTNVVTLSAKDVLDMTDNNNKLRIDGDGNDKVDIDSSFTQKADLIENGITYHRYEATYTDVNGNHTVTLEIKDQVQVF